MQNRNAPVALPDIQVGSGILIPQSENMDVNSPLNNENYNNMFSVNS